MVAELIIEEGVNVKQFGAKGDGIADDTEAIQKTFDHVKKLILNKMPFLTTPKILFTSGRYKITSTLYLSILCKIEQSGNVVLLSTITNGTTLKISSGDIAERYTGLSYLEGSAFEQGGIINGNGIFVIQHNISVHNDLSLNAIGLEIGDEGDTSTLPVSRTYLKNISIFGFNIGLKINSYNLYIITFKNMCFSKNTKNVVYGNDEGININAGEKIAFDNCLFAQAYYGLDIKSPGHFAFNNCSFDFLGCATIINKPQQTILNFNGGHFERFGNIGLGINVTEENCIGYGAIIYTNFTDTYAKILANFNGVNFFLQTSDLSYPLFKALGNYKSTSSNLNVVCTGCSFECNTPTKLLEDIFISSGSVDMKINANNDTSFPFLINDKDVVGNLSLLDTSWTDNSLDLDGNNLDLQNLGLQVSCSNQENGVNWSIDTENTLFGKSISFNINDDSYPAFKRTIPVKENKIASCSWFKVDGLTGKSSEEISKFTISTNYKFYTKAGTQISTLSLSPEVVTDNEYIRTGITTTKIPNGADYCIITNTIMAKNSSDSVIRITGTFKICGTLVEFFN